MEDFQIEVWLLVLLLVVLQSRALWKPEKAHIVAVKIAKPVVTRRIIHAYHKCRI
jgi:hypothetical protein